MSDVERPEWFLCWLDAHAKRQVDMVWPCPKCGSPEVGYDVAEHFFYCMADGCEWGRDV